jgi:hypothetical protein
METITIDLHSKYHACVSATALLRLTVLIVRKSYYDNLSLHLLFVTTFALNLHANVRRSAFFSGHPLTHCPRRIVPYMLSMPAIQLRHPMTFFVLLESDNRSPHLRFSSLIT